VSKRSSAAATRRRLASASASISGAVGGGDDEACSSAGEDKPRRRRPAADAIRQSTNYDPSDRPDGGVSWAAAASEIHMSRYFGGKHALGAQIAAVVLAHEQFPGQPYFEPFLGMAGVMRHVPPTATLRDGIIVVPRRRFGNDLQPDLVALWRAIQNGWEPPENVDAEFHARMWQNYRECRRSDGGIDASRTPSLEESALRAFVGFSSSWSGLYFRAYQPNRSARARHNLLAARESILSVELSHGSYEALELRGMLVYCDPPYRQPRTDHVNHYAGTPAFSQDRFWDVVRRWSERNVVLVSERRAPSDFVSVWSAPYVRRFSPRPTSDARCEIDVEQLFMLRQ
jgi:DNA adenine methylase